MTMANIGWTVDRSQDPDNPVIKQTAGPSFRDLNNYTALRLTQTDQRGFDRVLGAKFDLKKDIAWTAPTFLKTGFNLQEQNRKRWSWARGYSYTGPDGVLGTADDNQNLGQFTEIQVPTKDIQDYYLKDKGDLPVFPGVYAVAKHQKDFPELWKEGIAASAQSRLQGLRMVKEKISAAYVMGNTRLGDLSILAGLRFEDTRVTGDGPLDYISPAEKARRAAWVGVVTDAEARRRAEAQYGGRTTNQGKYNNYFPGVHLKYEPFAGFMTRLSWSTGIGRPDFGSIIPFDNVNDDTQRVTRNNPNLKPQYANSYDLTAEYYFKSQGVISFGVFKKNIADYIFTDSSQTIAAGTDNGFDGQYVGYALTTQANGGSAKIQGMEFNYQQQLSFLTGWAKGFGVNANFTSLKTEGNYGGTTVLTNNSLAGFLPKSGNVGLSYRAHGFDVRFMATYRGEYLTSNSATPSLVQYQVAKTTWNWRSRYSFTRNFGVFLDVDNVFAVPLDNRYRLYRDRGDSWRNFAQKIVAGVTGRF
jgi:iron complex outermembrane receptor protein